VPLSKPWNTVNAPLKGSCSIPKAGRFPRGTPAPPGVRTRDRSHFSLLPRPQADPQWRSDGKRVAQIVLFLLLRKAKTGQNVWPVSLLARRVSSDRSMTRGSSLPDPDGTAIQDVERVKARMVPRDEKWRSARGALPPGWNSCSKSRGRVAGRPLCLCCASLLWFNPEKSASNWPREFH